MNDVVETPAYWLTAPDDLDRLFGRFARTDPGRPKRPSFVGEGRAALMEAAAYNAARVRTRQEDVAIWERFVRDQAPAITGALVGLLVLLSAIALMLLH